MIRGEGMPRIGREGKGDLYVKLEVEMPGASWAARQDPSVSFRMCFVDAADYH